jgi:acetolactate synthase-1/2/3 large subunit
MARSGADLLIQEFQARGVPSMAVLCGNGLNPLLVAAAQAGLRLVDTRNEQAASYIADAYARLTGRVGVCAVSSGVAHANALAGILNAYYDGAPVLLISGASSSTTAGRGNFQDLDQVALARSICKRVELVTRPERIPQAVHEAFAAATSGRPGPVHLTIPLDVLSAVVAEGGFRAPFSTRGEVSTRAVGDADLISDAVKVLADAERPVIVAGSGVFYSRGGEALREFSELSHIPLVTPIWDRGVVDAPFDEYLGVVGAASGEPRILTEADAMLLAGARVDYRVRYLDSPPLARNLRIVRVDMDAQELSQGVEPDVGIVADCRTAFQQLADAWRNGDYVSHGDWLVSARNSHREFYSRWSHGPERSAGAMTGAHIIQALREVITEEVLLLIDGGNIGQWAHMTLCRDRYPRKWLTCGASGVVGWGVPGAMAARLAYPELASSSYQQLPFVVVVADDRAWGIVVSGQRSSCGFTVASELGSVDYAQVAQGLGARGVTVNGPDSICQAVREGFESGRPTLIHVPIAGGGPADS